MARMRVVFLAAVVCALAAVALPSRAQESETAPPAPDNEKKAGFWGDRFALFVDVATGTTDLGDLNASTGTGLAFDAVSRLTLDGMRQVEMTVGWTLPYDRGYFAVRFDGYREDGYDLSTRGLSSLFIVEPGGTSDSTGANVLWWTLDVASGNLRAERFPRTWNPAVDDANGNGIADPEEIQIASTPDLVADRRITDDLQNAFQTVDLLYGREFGKRRVGGFWSAGLRHFIYQGNIVTPAWLREPGLFPGVGFTDGAALPMLVFSQDTTGTGPTGSLGVVTRLLDERLQFYLEGRIAFVVSSLETDSGDFYTLLRDTTTQITYPAPAHLHGSVKKDTWNTMAEIGVRFRVARGLDLRASYFDGAFQDAVLLPSDLSVPENFEQFRRGTSAVYATQDLKVSGWRAGLRFQF